MPHTFSMRARNLNVNIYTQTHIHTHTYIYFVNSLWNILHELVGWLTRIGWMNGGDQSNSTITSTLVDCGFEYMYIFYMYNNMYTCVLTPN